MGRHGRQMTATGMVVAAVAFLVLGLGGCATGRTGASGPAVRKGAPLVHIHPLTESGRRLTVGVLPFQVPDNMAPEQGLRVAALFKDVMLAKRTFRTVRQLTATYGDLDDAVEAGRRAGLDLVLAGRVDYSLAGTELGGARVGVSVRVLDVASGNTVWYVTQGADQPMDYPDVSFSRRLLTSFSPPPVRPSGGAPQVPNMLARIAVDMAEVMAGAQQVAR